MRRTLICYAFVIAAISAIGFQGLTAISQGMIDYWRWANPEYPDLPSWTVAAPTVTRIGLIFSLVLFGIAAISLKQKFYRERYLIHGIAITALAQSMIAMFTAVAGVMPMVVTITAMPNE